MLGRISLEKALGTNGSDRVVFVTHAVAIYIRAASGLLCFDVYNTNPGFKSGSHLVSVIFAFLIGILDSRPDNVLAFCCVLDATVVPM